MPLLGLWGPRRSQTIRTAPAFGEFLTRRAAYVSQRATIEYCRARAGYNWDLLVGEPPFVVAMSHCQWEAYAAVLADLVIVAEGFLRPHAAPGAGALWRPLDAAFNAGLDAYPVPPHREDWDDVRESFAARLRLAQTAPVRPVHEVGKTSGNAIFPLLPIHPRLRRDDREVVCNNVRFNLCRVYEDMEEQVDAPAVSAALIASEEA